MTTSLPELLTADDLPLPELQALVLDGDLFRLDQVFCSVAEHDVPWRRAAALASSFGREFVVARLSAAWVWSGLASAPATREGFRPVLKENGLTGSRVGRARPQQWRDSPVGMLVSEVVLDPSDVADFTVVRVTTPLRTVVDLGRGNRWSTDVARILRALAAGHDITLGACAEVLERQRNLPHKLRALTRLESILSDKSARPPVGAQPDRRRPTS